MRVELNQSQKIQTMWYLKKKNRKNKLTARFLKNRALEDRKNNQIFTKKRTKLHKFKFKNEFKKKQVPTDIPNSPSL